jgi:hypothetical protein
MSVLINKPFAETADQKVPSMMEITKSALPFFQKALRLADKSDPFARSAGYYAMTGRKGLWLYRDDNTAMVMAIHPNKEDTLLFFPPFGKEPYNLIQKALVDPKRPSGGIQMARIGQSDMHLAMQLQALGMEPPHTEDILDWVYPVHVVSVDRLLTHQGGKFNNFRAHLNKAFKAGYNAARIVPQAHSSAILDIADRWAKDGKKDGYSYNDLTGPTQNLLSLMQDGILSLSGVIVFDDNKPIGFWIWDEGDAASETAMSLARISLGDRGAAEFAALKMGELLKERGFNTICLGGSETESLDRFKRKMGPVSSIELRTMALS